VTTEHVTPERLSQLVEGELAGDARVDVERHVAACATCHATLGRLRLLLQRAAALPPSIDPPARSWSAVRAHLQWSNTARHVRGARVREWALRAAAAVLLVAGSSLVTMFALRSRGPERPPGAAAVPGPGHNRVPATVVAIERSYADVVEELTATLEAQRGALAPRTIATIEHTLRVIDGAIAEARAALAADPANDALRDVLSANYEQKVQLLRRASELPART
jgi:anti-sigma factor RsiW